MGTLTLFKELDFKFSGTKSVKIKIFQELHFFLAIQTLKFGYKKP